MRFFAAITFISIIVINNSSLHTQQALNQTKELETIKKEITKYEKNLRREEKKEKDVVSELNALGNEILLRERLINKLKREEKRIGTRIGNAEKEIAEHREKLKVLQENSEARIVSLYKYGRERELEALLTSDSFSKTFTGLKYFLIVAREDRKKITELKKEKEELEQSIKRYRELLKAKKNTIDKKEEEIGTRNSRKKKEEDLLKKIRTNKAYYARLLRDKENAKREIEKLLGVSNNFEPVNYDLKFSSMKGNLPWPVEGKIITRHGLQRNQKLGTTTFNLGIEIDAPYGEKVRAVARGKVRHIKWMPFFGQTIIIKHGEGYYSGYAYLSNIHVELGQEVYPHDIIAEIGRDLDKNEPKLAFFIQYKGSESVDPELWLR